MSKNIRLLKNVISKKININIKNIIPDEIEKFIIKNIDKKPPYCYSKISDSELNQVNEKILKVYNININKHIIASIKSTFMKSFIIKNYYNLEKNSKLILQNYSKDGILKLSEKYNLSPMTITRFIFDQLFHKKLKDLLLCDKLSSFDREQFKIAEENDIYVTLNQTGQMEKAILFENKIEDFLIKNLVTYTSQGQLIIEQTKKFGKAINTPDFLITSELIINSKKVNWIDAKNFYGCNIHFMISKINKQIKKYLNTYGSGCIIFNYGFNSKISFPNVLILDYESMIDKS
jgi:hypothetical protein